MYKIYTAIITPFDDYDNLNLEAFNKLIKYQINNNCDGLIIAGTTGEGALLSKEEKLTLYKEAIKYKEKYNIDIYLNVGEVSTKETISLIKEIDHFNFDGYICITPYYLNICQEGVYQHFKEISLNTKKNIIVYNVPKRTNFNINFDTYKRLEQFNNIVGIKECYNDSLNLKKLKNETRFNIFIGNDEDFFESLSLNLDGIISVSSNIFIQEMKDIVNYKDYDKFLVYLPKFKMLFEKSNPIIIKTLVSKKITYSGNVRLPLIPLTKFEEEYYYKKAFN